MSTVVGSGTWHHAKLPASFPSLLFLLQSDTLRRDPHLCGFHQGSLCIGGLLQLFGHGLKSASVKPIARQTRRQ